MTHPVVDSHVHFWDPGELEYPWLEAHPSLQRAFLPADLARAARDVPLVRTIFVEGNCRTDQALAEARFIDRLAEGEPGIAGIVAYLDLGEAQGRSEGLDGLTEIPRVCGVRHNIQGNLPGFALRPDFVAGVREVGRRGLTFDLCVTHDQLDETLELARRCPDTPLVLDHCGKPPVGTGRLDPWRAQMRSLAELEHVHCKLSGLLTEAEPARREDADLLPYASHVVECFGTHRVMFGGDWPVLTLAGEYRDWYAFTRRFTWNWSPEETRRFYHDNALRFYAIADGPEAAASLPSLEP